ncbi:MULTISPECIES: hypothetical protein [unclassified Achromobacter]|uniref:hypothetical protein n=1 Tax=unclassified Achromobacter TaxID=2626865 RepID=UPI000B5171EF|nr:MULTISPECIES: hypothetical protein [unclassified Achromobacter]OWT77311.1 hypothetical protein CEY04_15250 [Achromobacter sp. HZ28]OWT78192.1 hypothetical protein CEY05_09745 [Achromobacter sp. HZ34]
MPLQRIVLTALRRADAAVWHGARHAVRYLERDVATPAAWFLYDSVDGVINFTRDLIDSAREVNRAMDRARAKRAAQPLHRF